MKRGSLTLKLLACIVTAFVVATAAILLLADYKLREITDRSQHAIYGERLDALLGVLARSDERLRKTGLVEAYTKDFQEAALNLLRQSHYRGKADQRIYPFLLDGDGRVLLHPVLARGDLSLQDTAMIRQLLSAAEGDFVATFQGEEKWYSFKRFPVWNWVAVYGVPLEIMYADARQFRTLLVVIMAGVSAAVLLGLGLVVTRFTRPIVRLTGAAEAIAGGNLDHPIEPGGTDEVGVLAASFGQMRDSVRRTIGDLQAENLERQQAQQALAEEKERLAVTLRSIGDGVITTDMDGRVALLNKVAEQLTGWSIAEAGGRPLAEVFRLVDARTGAACESPVAEILATGHTVSLPNHTLLIARDGTQRHIADSAAPIRDVLSRVAGVVLVFRDITDELKTEQELLKVKKLESIGVLAGGIAHDFNNILAAILGNLSLALFSPTLEEKTRRLLAEAEKASLRAKDLTQQLLTFAKGGDPVKETASLASVIRDSANFVLHGDAVVCEYRIPDDLWLVDIDRGQISQVIQNIVLNASHAMPGGGTIRIVCANLPSLRGERLPFLRDGRFVKISIQDTGIGMAPKVLEKIFDPYFTTKHEGSGLGLAITQSIIGKHQGHVRAESQPGAGSTFHIYLPASARAQISEPESPDVPTPGTTARILIMDDDEMVRDIAREMLVHLGHLVVLAADGEAAIARYRKAMDAEGPFDLVLMDLTIPGGMGGKEAVQGILALHPQARVIVSSGYSNDPVMAKFREHGFCAAIVKPYKLDELAHLIETQLAA